MQRRKYSENIKNFNQILEEKRNLSALQRKIEGLRSKRRKMKLLVKISDVKIDSPNLLANEIDSTPTTLERKMIKPNFASFFSLVMFAKEKNMRIIKHRKSETPTVKTAKNESFGENPILNRNKNTSKREFHSPLRARTPGEVYKPLLNSRARSVREVKRKKNFQRDLSISQSPIPEKSNSIFEDGQLIYLLGNRSAKECKIFNNPFI
ncbi:unnamed protein product [Blepharisma stoltei]|uniref:Uncharacterized protein n=1 Tax=Blepharisma stoltei TaxID=1481888 RepID=A0AAU9KEP0_9CILI|nr:unnamed protein product [Blepharisma stoltei]